LPQKFPRTFFPHRPTPMQKLLCPILARFPNVPVLSEPTGPTTRSRP
jgi:hypothetical protein